MPKRITALTDEGIARQRSTDKRQMIYDGLVPGLGIRIQALPSKHRSFMLGARYPGDGYFSRRALGTVGQMTLKDARIKARQWLASIERGIDPRTEEARREREAVLAKKNTFASVVENFITKRLPGQRKAKVVERQIRKEL